MDDNLIKSVAEGLTVWVMNQEYYSIQEAARVLHVSPRRIRECIDRRDDPMPFRCFPGQQRGAVVHRDDLRNWINRNLVLLRDEKHTNYKRPRSV